MTQYSEVHYFILLGQMLRSESIRSKASKYLQPQFFSAPELAAEGVSLTHGLIFTIIKAYHDRFQQAPDPAVVYAEAEMLLGRWSAPETATTVRCDLQRFFQFLPCVGPESQPLAEEMVQHITEVCYFEHEQRRLLNEALERQSVNELPQRIQELNSQRQAMTGGSTVSAISQIETEAGDRFFSGVSFIDNRCGDGKGIMNACLAVILAPQGAGKSTMGFQICVNQALLGQHALLVLVEEGLSASVRRNLISCATGIPTTVQEQHPNDLPKAATVHGLSWEGVKPKIENLDRYLHVLDLVENPGGPDIVDSEIERMTMQGQKPKVVYVDWAGSWARYLVSNSPPGVTFNGESMVQPLKYISDWGSNTAARRNISVWISQQMAPAIVQKGPFADNDQFCAEDCKAFTAPAKYCFVLNARDVRTDLQLFKFAKTRNDKPNQLVVVRHLGAVAAFEEAVGYAKQGKSFMAKTTAAKTNQMPTESSGTRNNTKVE